MAHKIIVNGKDITNLVGNLSWSSNIDTLGVQMTFDLAYSDMKDIPHNVVDMGDIITLTNKKIIFTGIVIDENKNGRNATSYTCLDFAFYLNKSKDIYQFNKISATDAIKQMLADYGVENKIISIPTLINKIYYKETISDIIKDILFQATQDTNNKYRVEMNNGKLNIGKQSDLIVNATFKLADNLSSNSVTDLISNPTRKRSIEDMKNSIIVISTKDDKATLQTTAKDDSNIAKYGLLQEIVTVNEKDIAQAKNIANNTLKKLNKVIEDNSIELLGNDDVRSGRLININEPITGIKGQFLVKCCTHTVSDGIHRMNLGLEVV